MQLHFSKPCHSHLFLYLDLSSQNFYNLLKWHHYLGTNPSTAEPVGTNTEMSTFESDPAFLTHHLFTILSYLQSSKLLQPCSSSIPPSLRRPKETHLPHNSVQVFCLHGCICTICVQYLQRCGACICQKRVSDTSELELQVVVSSYLGARSCAFKH